MVYNERVNLTKGYETMCDLCHENKAEYDARLPMIGSWANLCQSCFILHGCSLGLGKGQKLNED